MAFISLSSPPFHSLPPFSSLLSPPLPPTLLQVAIFKSLSHNIFENLAYEDWWASIYTVTIAVLQCVVVYNVFSATFDCNIYTVTIAVLQCVVCSVSNKVTYNTESTPPAHLMQDIQEFLVWHIKGALYLEKQPMCELQIWCIPLCHYRCVAMVTYIPDCDWPTSKPLVGS